MKFATNLTFRGQRTPYQPHWLVQSLGSRLFRTLFFFFFLCEGISKKYFINELNQLGIQHPTQMVDPLPIHQDLRIKMLFLVRE